MSIRNDPMGEAARRLLDDALLAHVEEHEQVRSTRQELKGRAKSAGVIAVLFVGGVVGYHRFIDIERGSAAWLLMVASVALGAFSIAVSLLSLLMRSAVELPRPEGERLAKVPSTEEELEQRAMLCKETAEAWEDASARLQRCNSRKSTLLFVAQLTLAMGIMVATAAVLVWTLA